MKNNSHPQYEPFGAMPDCHAPADQLLQDYLTAARRWHQGEKEFRHSFRQAARRQQTGGFPIWARAAVLALVATSVALLFLFQTVSRPYRSYSCNEDCSRQAGIELLESSIATL